MLKLNILNMIIIVKRVNIIFDIYLVYNTSIGLFSNMAYEQNGRRKELQQYCQKRAFFRM